MKKGNKGFTLVELIVVITILAILGTIAIMAFSGYSKNARDSARISDLTNMKKVLELWILQAGTYPEPTNGTGVTFTGGYTLWNQGTFGDTVFNTVGKLEKKPVDSLYDTEYTYSVTNSKKEYELGAVLEGTVAYDNILLPQTYAATESKQAYVSGNYNGILTTINSSPAYIVALPSIILSNITNTNLDGTSSYSLVYNKKSNLPSSYQGKNLTMTNAEYDFKPQVVWSGSTIGDINTQSGFQDMVTNLQTVYNSSSFFAGLPEYTTIATETGLTPTVLGSVKTIIETNTSQELKNVSITPVLYDCMFNLEIISNGTSTGAFQSESVPYGSSCISEQRLCTNGVLSGTFEYSLCEEEVQLDITGNGTSGSPWIKGDGMALRTCNEYNETLVKMNDGVTTRGAGICGIGSLQCLNDGVYYIAPDEVQSNKIPIYCDMTTEGGGWTLVFKADGTEAGLNTPNELNMNLLVDTSSGNARLSDSMWKNLGSVTKLVLSTNKKVYLRYDTFAWDNQYYDITYANEKIPLCSLDNISWSTGRSYWIGDCYPMAHPIIMGDIRHDSLGRGGYDWSNNTWPGGKAYVK